MNLRRKVFLGIFVTSLLAIIASSYLSYRFYSKNLEKDFISQYQNRMEVLSNTLYQLEATSDLVAKNAATAFQMIESRDGLGNTQELEQLAKKINVSNIFVADSAGRFIRSTNGPLELYKNTMFSYCDAYRGLLQGKSEIEQTPIIPSSDEATAGPFKYSMFPNLKRDKILEISLHLDYITNTLREVVNTDPNILELGLYSPNGAKLGFIKNIHSAPIDQGIKPYQQVEKGFNMREKYLSVYQRVESQNPQCCECKTKSLLKDGSENYFYSLKARVSNAPVVKASSDLLMIILGIGFLTGLGAFFIARYISDRLTRRILKMAQGISMVTRTKNMSLKLDESGRDEVSSLASGFNRLMNSLNKSQARLIEARKAEAMVELAQKVSHGLQAPVAAMKFLVSQLHMNPNVEVQGLKNLDLAIDEVDSIASKLLNREESSAAAGTSEARPSVSEIIDRCVAVRGVSPGLRIDIKRSGEGVRAAPEGFETVFSDLLQNAIDASGDFPAPIEVNFSEASGRSIVEIVDRGEGLDSEQVDDLFKKGFSTKDNGHGLGLYFAKKTVQSWGGDLVIRSGSGETVARLEW